MVKILLFMAVFSALGACSRYHERQGYTSLSSVPQSPHVDPSDDRLDAIDLLQKSKKIMEIDKNNDVSKEKTA